MKKTQKILDAIQYIDSMECSSNELDRLASEIEMMSEGQYEIEECLMV